MSPDTPDRYRVIDAALQFISDQFNNSVQSTEDDLTKIRADIDNLRFMITQMRSDIIEVVLRHEGPIQSQPKHLLPDPTYLENLTYENFRLWKVEVLTKLRVDGRAIGSEKDQFEYVLGRLAPKHSDYVRDMLQPREFDQHWDVNRILGVLVDDNFHREDSGGEA